MANYNNYDVYRPSILENPLINFYGWSALEMLARSPKAGFYVPWSGLPARTANIATGTFAKGMGTPGAGTDFSTAGIRFGGGRGFYKSKRGFFELGKRLSRAKSPIMRQLVGKNILAKAAGGAIGLIYWEIGLSLASIPVQAYKAIAHQVAKYRGIELGGYFPDSRASATSRQRDVRAITDSRLQARSSIGNEAQLFHR